MTTLSIFDLFSVGMGPSSSHSVGPMRAALRFRELLETIEDRRKIHRILIELYGSLALTGKGHATDKALLLGLSGHRPETIDPDVADKAVEEIRSKSCLDLSPELRVDFDEARDLLFHRRKSLPLHPNGMTMSVLDADDQVLLAEEYYSIGGGFILTKEEAEADTPLDESPAATVPFPFDSAAELVEHAQTNSWPISRVVWENEKSMRDQDAVRAGILERWQVMQSCVERGCRIRGVLPGGLQVERRAAQLFEDLECRYETRPNDPLVALDWVNLYALAVNEENAAGGRVVTAPTNGAAGIVPAVLHYYDRFCEGSNQDGIVKFFLTAGAIGMLYKKNASISGAEVGCQGEVGVACSMAAGGLVEAMGGSPLQVEEAAEIGMEHNLGLTCDPIKGLVQIPCIERNAMGAVKAINAARLALRGDGNHKVSLDKVIRTMRRTGQDMSKKYKETSRGGLAVNRPEC